MSTTDYAITKAELEANARLVADLKATLERRTASEQSNAQLVDVLRNELDRQTAVLRELVDAIERAAGMNPDSITDLDLALGRAKEELER